MPSYWVLLLATSLLANVVFFAKDRSHAELAGMCYKAMRDAEAESAKLRRQHLVERGRLVNECESQRDRICWLVAEQACMVRTPNARNRWCRFCNSFEAARLRDIHFDARINQFALNLWNCGNVPRDLRNATDDE